MDEWNRHRSLQGGDGEFEQDPDDRVGKRRKLDKECKKKLDDALERGLEETFPGSDPVAVTQPPSSAYDKCGK